MGATEKVAVIYYKTNGDVIHITTAISVEESTYLDKVQLAANDPAVTEPEMVELVWNADNPCLQTHPETGIAIADRDTYHNPVFQMMQDLIDKKRINLGTLDPEAAAARYTMSVKEASDKLGIHTATLRKAISAKRLAAWKRNGEYLLDPASVDSYNVSTRGARADVQFSEIAHGALFPNELAYREGTDGDYFLRIKNSAPLVNTLETPEGSAIKQGGIAGAWGELAVQTGKKSTNSFRMFILEEGDANAQRQMGISFAGFYVRGNFKVVKTINNAKEALAAWKAYEPI